MDTQNFSQFEHTALEADMDRLAGEIMRHKETQEMKGAGDKELIKAALRSITPTTTTTQGQQIQSSQTPLPGYMANFPNDAKLEVEYLLDVAVHRGVIQANKEAKGASPAVLDAFHDALAALLQPELQKRGMFK